MKEGLRIVGVHTSLLKGQTTRAASTTEPDVAGVSTFDIMKQGLSPDKSTFPVFKTEIIDHNKTFQASILHKMFPRMTSGFKQKY